MDRRQGRDDHRSSRGGLIRAFLILLAACGAGAKLAPNELYVHGVSYPDAGVAHVGRAFSASPAARCEYGDGRPSEWATRGATVSAGELPPGIKLDDGVLTGTPTKAGTYHATIEFHGVACGGKPFADQRADVTLTVR